MKQIFLIIAVLFLFLQYDFCLAQERITTSYQNEDYDYLDISLNGKVKFLKQISYLPNKLCGTRPCEKETFVYLFDTNLLPQKINFIRFYMEASNKLSYEEEIYKFKKGYLVQRRVKNSPELTKYKYNSKGYLISIKDYYAIFYLKAAYEYDNQNRLIQIKENAGIKIIFPIMFYKTIEIYKYDTMGNLVEKRLCDIRGANKCEDTSIEKFVYDENNRLIKKTDFSKGQTYNHIYYYEYDEKSNMIDEKVYGIKKDTALFAHYVYEYNDNGQETRKEGKRKLGYTLITTYDENRNTTQQERVKNDGIVEFIHYVYSYDSFGNWIKKETYTGESEENLSKILTEERIIEYYQQ